MDDRAYMLAECAFYILSVIVVCGILVGASLCAGAEVKIRR